MTNDDDLTLPVKRSKHFADKDVPSPKVAEESSASASKRKSPAKAAATKSTKASPAKKAAQKPASKSKKAVVLDSDDDDDDGDFQASHACVLPTSNAICSGHESSYTAEAAEWEHKSTGQISCLRAQS